MFNIFKKKKVVSLLAPMVGEIIPIDQVPDAVFAGKMVGDGVAIKPQGEVVVAPYDGKNIQVFSTKHAIGMETSEGIEILIHIGLDTVSLKGKGFESYVKSGDYVKQGDKLLKIDLDYIQNHATSTISPIVITNMDRVEKLHIEQEVAMKTGSKMMDVYIK